MRKLLFKLRNATTLVTWTAKYTAYLAETFEDEYVFEHSAEDTLWFNKVTNNVWKIKNESFELRLPFKYSDINYIIIPIKFTIVFNCSNFNYQRTMMICFEITGLLGSNASRCFCRGSSCWRCAICTRQDLVSYTHIMVVATTQIINLWLFLIATRDPRVTL